MKRQEMDFCVAGVSATETSQTFGPAATMAVKKLPGQVT